MDNNTYKNSYIGTMSKFNLSKLQTNAENFGTFPST